VLTLSSCRVKVLMGSCLCPPPHIPGTEQVLRKYLGHDRTDIQILESQRDVTGLMTHCALEASSGAGLHGARL
jgi:hypothetical protein